MKKNEELYIKINLGKNTDSGEITPNIQFDNNAPNFNKDKDVISWNPSVEEWTFVNEVFEMISKGQGYKYGKKQIFERNEAEEEDVILPTNENEIVDEFVEENK